METPDSSLGVLASPIGVLHAATARVARRLDWLVPPLTPGGPARAQGHLDTLRSKIEQVLHGDDPKLLREWLASNPLSLTLADALASELIDSTVDPEGAPAALTVLRVLTAVRRPGGAGATSSLDRSDDLRARMHGPDAFELLVEVAHDFRSPLTSILFLAEALRDGHSGPVTDAQRSQLGLIYSAAFGLASIASDVMDLARREQDLIGAEPEAFPLAEVFQRVERMVQPLVEEKGLRLRVVVPESWQGHGHSHALSRVLLNLTTNALKFTDEGFVDLGVRPIPHGRMEFYVHDTGRGISPEQQKNLFQPFRMRSGSSEDGHYFSSSGIGLSIARRLLRAMGSDLSLDSSDERGTRFSFTLPAIRR